MIKILNALPVVQTFHEQFQTEPLLFRSPGRVNIIGEHTDYNEGFVLPAAIDKSISIAISKRDDDQIELFSAEFEQKFSTSLSTIKKVDGWPAYVLGVVDQLLKKDYQLTGFNLVLDGDIPIGAGLSSSAAVECATLFALNEIFGYNLSRMEMALLAQAAEHEFAGVKCGIMDQFASLFGKKNFAVKLDCKTMQYEYVPLHLGDYRIVLLNTNVKHSLASSEYNTRREECEQGVEWVKAKYDVESLRNVTVPMLDELVKDPVVYRRCRYVVEEISRLQDACNFLKEGNLRALGKKMFQTHDGLSREYEVSCDELDFLVSEVRNNSAVIGARMMGGGFGGCTINLVKENAIEELSNTLSEKYRQTTGLELTVYVANIENGTHIVH